RRPDASDAEIREALAGNLCRCTGYGRILAAVDAVVERRSADMGGGGEGTPVDVAGAVDGSRSS
ncbi:MAG TPA: 2Fe-2S iron-sulfur cluster-binding protein, partial [Acidimicrobiales bacterium]|nr:2Fe-2S iron-sulfur cluster-binding protein [Acidimicrobiales bacterium]